MIQLQTKFESVYLRKLRSRLEWLEKTNGVGFKLDASQAPYWHWLEYGTRQGKGPYVIIPKTSSRLVFISEGALHFSEDVLHPGIHPHRFVASSLPQIRRMFRKNALKLMANTPELMDQFLDEVGQKAKQIIVDNLAAVTKSPAEKAEQRQFGTAFPKQAGRLGGEAVAEHFNRVVRVVRI